MAKAITETLGFGMTVGNSKRVINKPNELKTGDECIIVTYFRNRKAAAKLNVVYVTELKRERSYQPSHKIGNKEVRLYDRINWGDDIRGKYIGGVQRTIIFRIDQRKEAEHFAKVEVPKIQLQYVQLEIDRVQSKFTKLMGVIEVLEKKIQENEKPKS